MKTLSIHVRNLAETEALGRCLAAQLAPGMVIALIGTLGAGKTHLVRAIAVGLQIPNPDIVNSPTFVLIQEYDARLPIYHFDAYRLLREADFVDLGVHEYFAGDGVCLVEWADKVASCLPNEYLEIRIRVIGDEARQFEIAAHGPRYEALVAALGEAQK